jgi:hypothetical protein
MPLTDLAIRNAKAKAKPYKLSDVRESPVRFCTSCNLRIRSAMMFVRVRGKPTAYSLCRALANLG